MTVDSDKARDSDKAGVLQFPAKRNMRHPFDPPPEIVDFAAHKPVTRARIWNGSTPWLVTGNAELRSLATDTRVSVNEKLPGYPHWSPGMEAGIDSRPDVIMTLDGAEHSRLRRLATRSFSVKRVNALRPAMQEVLDRQLDEMLAGPQPADLVTQIALPIPSTMICQLLGVPYEDHGFFEGIAANSLDQNATPEQSQNTIKSMVGYMEKLFARAESDGDIGGVVGDYVEYVKAGEMTSLEAFHMCIGLLFAGHETSANMIGLGVVALLQNPDQLAVLRDSDDPGVIAGAVEELLRYLAIIHAAQRRIAIEDIEIAGETIRAGEGILMDFSGGNWDARTFPGPERLDLSRNAGQHLAFGFGPHGCVGQQLARAELQVVFGSLFKRVPTLELAVPLDEVRFKTDRLAYGVYSLPVTW
jgi:cytochrome P450